MTLVTLLAVGPDALRADMQRFYNLDLDEVGHAIRVMRAADLAANLPDEARVWGRIDPRAGWGTDRQLLANIADSVSFLAWTKTRDAARRGARWKGAIPRPGAQQAGAQAGGTRQEGVGLDADAMRGMLSRPRS